MPRTTHTWKRAWQVRPPRRHRACSCQLPYGIVETGGGTLLTPVAAHHPGRVDGLSHGLEPMTFMKASYSASVYARKYTVSRTVSGVWVRWSTAASSSDCTVGPTGPPPIPTPSTGIRMLRTLWPARAMSSALASALVTHEPTLRT